MPESIDDLARRWKARPDAAGTVAFCDALRKSTPGSRVDLIDEVAKVATEQFGARGEVLVAVAALYAQVDRLSDAQAVLIAAGKAAPRDPSVYRLLGEVLLRRGDAERAEKVLQRAKQLGADDPETAMWMDRAKVFKPVQAKAGVRAVAIEVKNTAVHPVTPLPHLMGAARPRAESVDPDGVTSIRNAPAIPWSAEAEVAQRPKLSIPEETTLQRGPDYRPELAAEAPHAAPPDVDHEAALDVMRRPTGPMQSAAVSKTELSPVARPVSPPVPLRGDRDLRDAPVRPVGDLPEDVEEQTSVRDKDRLLVAATGAIPGGQAGGHAGGKVSAKSASKAARPPAAGPAGMPAAREVLDALANAGVFEPREAATNPVQWDRPNEKPRRRTAVALSVGMVLFVLGSGGVLNEIHRRRARAHDEAEAALARVEADLNASQASRLPDVEKTIGHAFELDSRSPRAALDWLEERAVKGLLLGGSELAFEDAVTRATEVKVPEAKISFARVASFLFQGDTGGAAGLMPKLDAEAANEPLYQLLTGATLEHAGDPHAAERYQAAAKLAPSLLLAEMMLARATAIDGDPAKAADLAKQFRAKHPERAEGAALVALAWGRDPARGDQPPPDVAETVTRAGELPLPLMVVPHALSAIASVEKHALPEAKTEIEKGLAVADDPGMATWMGNIALETHDEALVRKAATLAVTFSAVYAPARVLAARIALLGGRLDEALKATEDLDPTSPDVAIVRAASAYERMDADAMGRALEAAPGDARKLPEFTALNLAPDVLLGRDASAWTRADAPAKLYEMSSDDAPWSDLIAMDAALDLGLTDVADKIAADWRGTEDKPLRAIRLSRLERYENHLDSADRSSKVALDTATVTPRMLIERVLVLVAKNRAADVGSLLARYPLVLGSASSWLSAYALASVGKVDEARGRTAQLDVPPALSPLPFRVLAAVSLAAMKDRKRAEPAIRDLLAAGSGDPDLMAAAASVGLRPPTLPAVAAKAAAPVRAKGKR